MFEQTFKNIDGMLHKNVGCGSEWDDYHHSEGDYHHSEGRYRLAEGLRPFRAMLLSSERA